MCNLEGKGLRGHVVDTSYYVVGSTRKRVREGVRG